MSFGEYKLFTTKYWRIYLNYPRIEIGPRYSDFADKDGNILFIDAPTRLYIGYDHNYYAFALVILGFGLSIAYEQY